MCSLEVLIGCAPQLHLHKWSITSSMLGGPLVLLCLDQLGLQVLLLMWTQNIDLRMQLQAMELFSGEAKVSSVLRSAGVSCVSYDLLYDESGRSMNFLSPGGFAFTAINWQVVAISFRVYVSIEGHM